METNESDEKIAQRFKVSRSWVNKLVRQYQQTGSYDTLPHRGGMQPLLTQEQLNIVVQLVEENNDLTLQHLSERLLSETGVKVSVSTLCRLLQKLELTRKKASA